MVHGGREVGMGRASIIVGEGSTGGGGGGSSSAHRLNRDCEPVGLLNVREGWAADGPGAIEDLSRDNLGEVEGGKLTSLAKRPPTGSLGHLHAGKKIQILIDTLIKEVLSVKWRMKQGSENTRVRKDQNSTKLSVDTYIKGSWSVKWRRMNGSDNYQGEKRFKELWIEYRHSYRGVVE
jgi:hypothetical protein